MHACIHAHDYALVLCMLQDTSRQGCKDPAASWIGRRSYKQPMLAKQISGGLNAPWVDTHLTQSGPAYGRFCRPIPRNSRCQWGSSAQAAVCEPYQAMDLQQNTKLKRWHGRWFWTAVHNSVSINSMGRRSCRLYVPLGKAVERWIFASLYILLGLLVKWIFLLR